MQSIRNGYAIDFRLHRVSYIQGWSGTVYAAKAGLQCSSSFLCSSPEASMPAVWTEGMEPGCAGLLACHNRVEEGSCVRRILSACENTPRIQDRRLVTSFLKAENYSWNEGSGSSQMYWVGMSLLQNIHYCLLLFFNSIFKLSCI